MRNEALDQVTDLVANLDVLVEHAQMNAICGAARFIWVVTWCGVVANECHCGEAFADSDCEALDFVSGWLCEGVIMDVRQPVLDEYLQVRRFELHLREGLMIWVTGCHRDRERLVIWYLFYVLNETAVIVDRIWVPEVCGDGQLATEPTHGGYGHVTRATTPQRQLIGTGSSHYVCALLAIHGTVAKSIGFWNFVCMSIIQNRDV